MLEETSVLNNQDHIVNAFDVCLVGLLTATNFGLLRIHTRSWGYEM